MKKNIPILLVDSDDTIERPIKVLIKKKLVSVNVVVDAIQDNTLFLNISEQIVGKQKYSELNDLMYLLPNYQLLSKKEFSTEKAEQEIYKSIRQN